MKHLLVLSTYALLGVSLPAQTPIAGVQKAPEGTVRKHVLPSPMSIRPRPSARPSTAQAGPMHAGWRPLNELPAFPLVNRDGQATTLPDPSGGSRYWLMLYRTATCIPCDRLMLALQGSGGADLKAGKPIVIVVDSPDVSALERVHASFTGLSDATWAADREKAVATNLKLHGAPVLIAMDGKRVAWRVAGNLDSTDTVIRMTNSWLASNSIQADQAPGISWKEANQAEVTKTAAGATSAPRQ